MRDCSVVDVIAIMWTLLMTRSASTALRDGFYAKRLYDDMLQKSKYNHLIRPVSNESDSLVVRVGLRLTSIIDVVSTTGFSYSNHTLNNVVRESIPVY